jgi:hypothetical protein
MHVASVTYYLLEATYYRYLEATVLRSGLLVPGMYLVHMCMHLLPGTYR